MAGSRVKLGWIKKLFLVGSLFFVLFLTAAIAIPFFIDVDKYRPDIVKAANEKINGKLELGKLHLSLWGQIRIEVDGITLTDAQGVRLISVKDAFFHVPFTSILSGAPLLTLKMARPEIVVIKDKSGKLNALSLVKSQAPATPPPTAQPSAPPAKPDATKSTPSAKSSAPAPQSAPVAKPSSPAPVAAPTTTTLPAIATRTRLGFELTHANVLYKDETQGLTSQFKDLNLLVKDLSLSRSTEIKFWANLDTRLGKTLTVKGPAKLEGHFKPDFSGSTLEGLESDLDVNLNDLAISVPGTFEKKKGVPARLEANVEVSKQKAKIEKFVLKFNNAVVTIKGSAENLPLGGAAAEKSPTPSVDLDIASNEVDFKPWPEMLPSLKGYDLTGMLQLKAQAHGPSDQLKYQADVHAKGLTAKAPNLKVKPVINVNLQVVTDQVKDFNITLAAPENDLRINGNLVSFTQPRFKISVQSSGMDLDHMMDLKPPAKGSGKNQAFEELIFAVAQAAETAKAPPSDLDKSLEPLRTNPVVAAAVGDIHVDIKEIKAYGVALTDIRSQMTMKNLVAAVDSFGMKVWDGQIQSSLSMDLKPKMPTYRFKASVNGLDLKKAVQSQLEMFKNTVIGTANFQMEGSGASFNTEPAKRNLVANGKLKVANAQFTTIDVAKMVSEALTKAMSSIGDKIPGLKDKLTKATSNRESKYEYISADFTIAKGVFQSPNFETKALPKQGIDLKGNTKVGFVDNTLDAKFEVIDTYNMTGARDLSVDIAGHKVEHILAKGNDPVKFPIGAGCKLDAPCYHYEEAIGYLAKVALGNTTGIAKSVVQDKAKDAAKKFFGGQNGKDALKKLFKR